MLFFVLFCALFYAFLCSFMLFYAFCALFQLFCYLSLFLGTLHCRYMLLDLDQICLLLQIHYNYEKRS